MTAEHMWAVAVALFKDYAVVFMIVFTFVSAVAALLGSRQYFEQRGRRRRASAPRPAAGPVARSLADNLPNAQTPVIAQGLNHLGNVYRDAQRHAQAEQAYREALDIYGNLGKENPLEYQPLRARTLENLGALYRDMRRYEEALEAFAEALELYRGLSRHQPADYRLYLWNTLKNLDMLHGLAPVSRRQRSLVQRELAEIEPQLH